jgi:transcriptional regulator with XRE-family HTH domain
MARKGPYLPRKNTALMRSRQSVESAAYQIGVMLCFQRVRWNLTQDELAAELGVDQIQVSNVENGSPSGLTDAKIDALFKRLDLADATGHAAFLKWWNRHERDL